MLVVAAIKLWSESSSTIAVAQRWFKECDFVAAPRSSQRLLAQHEVCLGALEEKRKYVKLAANVPCALIYEHEVHPEADSTGNHGLEIHLVQIRAPSTELLGG